MKLRVVFLVQAIFSGGRVQWNVLQNDVVGCIFVDVQSLSKYAPQKSTIEIAITIQR
jgi:hypothetical protein